MRLTDLAEWPALRAELERRLAARRDELEAALDHDQTSFVRGQIAQLRDLLSDGSAPPVGAPPPRYTT